MVEVHGWITLRYSDYNSEALEQEAFVHEFKQFLYKNWGWVVSSQDGQIGNLTNRNGLNCFAINTQHNHPDNPFYALDIFTWAAKNSTGSYGMLYFHDDEDEAHHNEFQVFVLKRGKLVRANDQFLSPCVEEIEKEYDENNPPKD